MIVTVTLNPAVDCSMYVTEYTGNAVNRAERQQITAGGKGINISLILERLGIDTLAYTFCGGETGQLLCHLLDKTGLNYSVVWLENQLTRINFKLHHDKSETEINGTGTEIPSEILDSFISELDKKLKNNDVLILAGSLPPSSPPDTYAYIMKKLSHKNLRIVADTSGKALLEILPYKPFLIKPNNHELADILRKPVNTPEEASAGARDLQKLGAGNIIVSLAEMGSVLLTADGTEYRIKAPSGTVKNSVGAGDSMLAGFLAGLEKTGDFALAHVLGTACGSATAFSDGLAEKQEIIRILNEMLPDSQIVQKFFDIEF
ncbi:MAG: 1-phosphofructokinase [Ruminococcus sp.]|nr:1-phosphofructokinase [Ruminococcus sp.]